MTNMAHRTQILKYMYSVAKFQVTIILYINDCLVKSEEANTKKVTPCRNRNVLSSLFRTLTKNILTHEAEYLDFEIPVSKAGKGTTRSPFQNTLPGWALWSSQSLLMQGRPLSVSLRSETPRGIGIMFHMPDARLYSPARLQQFSKNACNSKYFSLNRSMFADLGITGTFPDTCTPISSICPESLGGATPQTQRYT